MNKEVEGFVIYNKSEGKNGAYGVVSDSYECKALSNKTPSRFKKFIVPVEDKRFYKHNGIDFRGISRALVRNVRSLKIIEGGSTISQQLARNILNDNSKTLHRKVKEAIKALELETKFSKDEILNLYFENVYFGKNLRGIRIASIYYFDKEPENLNQNEVLFLITILRGPNYYVNNLDRTKRRMQIIVNVLLNSQTISLNQYRKLSKRNQFLTFRNNPFVPIKTSAIPYISEKIDFSKKIVFSTLLPNYQNFAENFVKTSKYPTSIIIIKNEKVVGFSSYYGTDYPFVSRSNVGSTLKPFLYCQLRDNGISAFEKFDAFKNNLGWEVREVGHYKSQLNIQEALFHSNNNVFLNAANKIGFDTSFKLLAETFNKPITDFYPSSVLGATQSGISLYELALAYSNYFNATNLTDTKTECLTILNKIFYEKLGLKIENAFLKTGTTNNNKERYAVLGNADLTFAILRNENKINDESKDGNFMRQIARSISSMFKPNTNFKWI